MPKIIISKLTIGGETFPAPPGLSELLEGAWVHQDDIEPNTILDQYDCKDEKVNGKWRTVYTKKKKKVN